MDSGESSAPDYGWPHLRSVARRARSVGRDASMDRSGHREVPDEFVTVRFAEGSDEIGSVAGVLTDFDALVRVAVATSDLESRETPEPLQVFGSLRVRKHQTMVKRLSKSSPLEMLVAIESISSAGVLLGTPVALIVLVKEFERWRRDHSSTNVEVARNRFLSTLYERSTKALSEKPDREIMQIVESADRALNVIEEVTFKGDEVLKELLGDDPAPSGK